MSVFFITWKGTDSKKSRNTQLQVVITVKSGQLIQLAVAVEQAQPRFGHKVLPDPPFGFHIVTLFTVVLLAFGAEATMLNSNSRHKKTSPCHYSKN
jgi:hypothetical protein